MQEKNFMKEALNVAEQKIVLVILSKKQLKVAQQYSLESLAPQGDGTVIVALKKETLKNELLEKNSSVFIVNASGTQTENEDYFTQREGTLTGIQIGIEKGLFKLRGDKKIFFDSLGELSKQADERTLQRFIYILCNKLKLNSVSGIMVAESEEIDDETIAVISQFFDSVFDYSKIILEQIDLN